MVLQSGPASWLKLKHMATAGHDTGEASWIFKRTVKAASVEVLNNPKKKITSDIRTNRFRRGVLKISILTLGGLTLAAFYFTGQADAIICRPQDSGKNSL